jgi:hypothetical protein
MKSPLRFVLLLGCLALLGCATPEKPGDKSSGYVPYKDRPPSGKEY